MRAALAAVLVACAVAIAPGAASAGIPDPLATGAWHLARVGADPSAAPAAGVAISFVDSLVDRTYPDLDAAALELLSSHTDCVGDDTPHATAVAAVAAAPANGIGTVGVFPGARAWSVNACSLDDPAIIAAIDAAIARGRSVITLSLGGPGYSKPLWEAVARAVRSGSLVIAAAGNYGGQGNPVIFPAAYPHVLTVASVGRDDRASSFSGTTSNTDLAAPGEEIPVLDPLRPTETLILTGTSYATPIVSAIAAWVWTLRPGLDASQLGELLRRSADDVAEPGFDAATGFGVVDLPAALAASTPPSDPGEPNDDVDQVVAGRLFPDAAPALVPGARLVARLDAREDPRDVYRATIPAGARLEARVTRGRITRVSLLRAATTSVTDPGQVRRHRLASSGKSGVAAFSNRSTAPLDVFVVVSPRGASARATYTLRLSAAGG